MAAAPTPTASWPRRAASRVANWLNPAPRAALAVQRQPAPFMRRFDAAQQSRLTAAWHAENLSINEELRGDLDRLRARGRNLAKNNDYAAKFVGMVRNNIIGPAGFTLQVRVEDAPGKPDDMANRAIENAWAQWSNGCDLTGTLHLRDLCETLVGSLPTDGEFLVRVVVGPDSGNPYGMALQPIDADRIDTTYHTGADKNGIRVVTGIEQDTNGRPLAVWLFDGHPNNGANSTRQRTRIPVAELLHRYKVETPGQARGIPWMTTGMLSLHHLQGFKLAALLAAEHGANHYGFFYSPDGQPPPIAQDSTGDDGAQITTSQPGTFDTLPEGYRFEAFDSKYPSDNFGPFVKTTLQRIATGWRVAYHSLANDLEGVSFSSIRSGTLEDRDRWSADQAWFANAFLEPIYQTWLRVALLGGKITMPNGSPLPASKIAKFSAHEWQGRRWEWVDPKADIDAKIAAVRAGLMAPQDLAAQMGYDFNDVLAKISAAQKLASSYGVTLTAYEATPGAAPANQPAAAADAAKKQADETAQQLRQLSSEERQTALVAAVAKLASRQERPITVNTPPVNVTVERSEPVQVHNHIPAAPRIASETTKIERDANLEAMGKTTIYEYAAPGLQ